MKLPVVLLTLLGCSFLGFGQQVSISGSVINAAGAPVINALVTLEGTGLHANSYDRGSTAGTFRIQGTVSVVNKSPRSEKGAYYEVGKGRITLRLLQTPISVTAYDIRGALVSKLEVRAGSGTHVVPLPSHSRGVTIWRVAVG